MKVLIKERKHSITLIFFILLFNPCFYFWASKSDLFSFGDKCAGWLICLVAGTALCYIDLFLKKIAEKVFLSVLFALSVAPNIIVWGYMYISNSYVSKDIFWAIFDTNSNEAKEFIQQFDPSMVIAVLLLYLAIGIMLIIRQKSHQSLNVKRHKAIFSLSVTFIVFTILMKYFAQAIPTFGFYNSYISYIYAKSVFRQMHDTRKNLKISIECALEGKQHIFVVVIGESASSLHQSLYGYHRATTPRLDSISDELDVFEDVVSPAANTSESLKKALTFANYDNPEYYSQKPDIVELFNSADFETYWISNQLVMDKLSRGGTFGVFAKEAGHLYDMSIFRKNDEVVLPCISEILNDSIRKNKIIFVHLMGNHQVYSYRYPEDFERFDNRQKNDLDAPFRNENMKRIIDEYDNSILYGDYINSSIIEMLRKIGLPSCFLFFSDHAEEVFDYRNISGHFPTNISKYQVMIPLILWRSGQYLEETQDIVIDKTRPYSSEDLIHSLSTLCRLKYADYEPERSLFSPQFIPKKRMIGHESLDDIIRKESFNSR
ncbi:MAG: sulfatase-like hydrolase/transferase [Tannerella sp.]|nr:sulfatase-like hydrolase/transferase [Tannerella sp.]